MKCVVLCASLLASFSLPLLADSIVVFNEIMYQPATAEVNAEWVELHNQNAVDVDLSGWSIANGISFTFPEGTRLRGKGYLVVALNPSWLATNAGVTTAMGPFTGRLANGGERIELKDRNQRVMDSVRYNNDGFWPQAPAGTGLSLAKRDPNLGGSRGENWVQSGQIGGTPGLRNFPSGLFEPQPGLVAYWPLNELSGPADDLTSPINAQPTGLVSQSTELISGSLRFPASGSGSLDLGRDIGDRLSPDSGFTLTALLQPTWDGSGRATVFRKEADRSGTLSAYWSFDEASTGTNAALELVNKNHGFFRSGTVRTNGLQGSGAALFRNGGSEGINVGTGVSNSFSFTQGITLAAWIRLQWNGATNTYDAIFAKDDGTNRITFAFQHDASNSLGIVDAPPGPVLAFGANIAGTYTELDLALDGQDGRPTLDQLRDGNAHHVAATFDSTTGNMEIWVDGTRRIVATKPGQLRTGGNAPAFIGNRSTSGTSAAFTGVIDEMAIWSSALNASEISRLAGGVSPPELAPTIDAGNRIQFGFRLQGDVDFTDPPVGTTPALGLEFRTSSGFQRLEVLLDGQGSRPTLAALQARPTHVAAFYDPVRRSMGIALDGIVIGSGTAEGRLDAAGIGASFIGNASSAGSEPYRGLLDEPTLWARALTQTELDRHARLARANKPFYAPDIQSLPALAFSELQPPNSNNYWIELVNHGSTPLELGGILLGSSSGGLFVFPQGLLEPASYLVLTQNAFGFKPQAGDLLSLYTPGRTHVIDSVRVNAGAFARVTPGLSPWRIPRTSTPGGPNTFTFRDQVVINEVFYKAPPIYSVPAQSTNITLVAMESDWRYHQAGEDLGTAWSETSFDDSAWPVGKALFHNETANLPATKNTPLNLGPITYYFRKTFTVDYAPSNVVLRIRTILDDGAVVHINGAPVARINMRSGPVTYTNLAQNVNNATLSSWTTLVVSNLVQGDNLLAVELHQTAINSDDAVFGLELDARVPFSPGRAFAENPEQWIELHNRSGSAVDLSGWRFDAGVDFTIPPGTSLAPQGYLVVASDPTTLNAKYPGLGALGPWARRLSGSSDRISLVDDSGNPVDEVRYYNSGYWPEAADGGGSSLELKDPQSDNAFASAWAPSQELQKGKWQTLTYRGTGAQNGSTPDIYNELVIGLLDSGEVLLDDITVRELSPAPGPVLIQNPGFTNGLERWRIVGNHKGEWVNDPDDPANKVLRLVATGMTEHMNNHVETTLRNGNTAVTLADNRQYEISLRARWVSGSPQLNTRLYFNRMPRTFILDMHDRWGTPGSRNSRAVDNLGPVARNLIHEPAVPPVGTPVTVSVDASDPQGVDSCVLWWTTNRTTWETVTMTRDGSVRFAGQIPPLPAGRVAQFYVEATDGAGAKSVFPPLGRESRALVQANDGQANLALTHNLRLIMMPSDSSFLLARTNLMSNGRVPSTFIYNEQEIFYDAGVRLKGSEHGRPNDDRIGFNVDLHPDHPFRGVHETIAIDRSGGWRFGRVFGQDEILINHIINHAGGVPGTHNDLIRVIGPTARYNGPAILQMARYNPLFLDSQFERGADNPVFEYELYYGQSETIPSGAEGYKVPQEGGVSGYALGDQGDDKENYRLGYAIKNRRDRDDFETLIQRLKIFSISDAATFNAAADQMLDVDQWLRAFALAQLCGANDNYSGSGSQHNLHLYVRPSDGKLLHLLWDLDFAFHIDAGGDIYNNSDLAKLTTRPANNRTYLRHLRDILNTTYNTSYMAYWVDHYDNFTPGQNFGEILTYIQNRSATARGRFPRQVPFGITSNGGRTFATNSPTALISGSAWLDAKNIAAPGAPSLPAFTWTSVTNWRAAVPLILGSNLFTFSAIGDTGEILSNATITVIGTAVSGSPDLDNDGLPDVWETIYDFDVNAPNGDADIDRDGFSNLDEYLAGTDPRNASSGLSIGAILQTAEGIKIRFNGVTGRSYSIQHRDVLPNGAWKTLGSVPAVLSDQTVEVLDANPGTSQRYYRLVTPSTN